MSKIILTADDYGYSPKTNEAVVDAVKKGVITSVHVLVNMVEEEDLKPLIDAVKGPEIDCGIGLHFNHTDGKPVLNRKSSIITENGKFYPITTLDYAKENSYDVYLELHAQLNKMKELLAPHNIPIDAFSSHNNIHFFSKPYLKIIKRFAKEEHVPVRSPVLWHQHKRPNLKMYPFGFFNLVKRGMSLKFSMSKRSTRDVFKVALRPGKLRQRRRLLNKNNVKTPTTNSPHWLGHPTISAIEWSILQMNYLNKHNMSTEIFTHLIKDESENLPDLAHSKADRKIEYDALTSDEMVDVIKNRNHGVQFGSYRSILNY